MTIKRLNSQLKGATTSSVNNNPMSTMSVGMSGGNNMNQMSVTDGNFGSKQGFKKESYYQPITRYGNTGIDSKKFSQTQISNNLNYGSQNIRVEDNDK